jgi:hypothetical protein
MRPLGHRCHRPSSDTASLGDEGVTGRLVGHGWVEPPPAEPGVDQRGRQCLPPTRRADRRGAGATRGGMYTRTLYLACFGYRRSVTNGQTFDEWGFIRPRKYFTATAAATRAAVAVDRPSAPRSDRREHTLNQHFVDTSATRRRYDPQPGERRGNSTRGGIGRG